MLRPLAQNGDALKHCCSILGWPTASLRGLWAASKVLNSTLEHACTGDTMVRETIEMLRRLYGGDQHSSAAAKIALAHILAGGKRTLDAVRLGLRDCVAYLSICQSARFGLSN